MTQPPSEQPDFETLISDVASFSELCQEFYRRFQLMQKSLEELKKEYNDSVISACSDPKHLPTIFREVVHSLIDYKFQRYNDFWISSIDESSIPHPFVSIEERARRGSSTRFISFINFKGGVGKTTLAANLAAAFSAGNYTSTPWKGEMRVLVVDLDFQGTLSSRCVAEQSLLNEALRHEKTSGNFFINPSDCKFTLKDLELPIIELRDESKIVPGDQLIDYYDNKYFIYQLFEKKETRFCFRSWFHQNYVFENYDLVIFDCPPRKTASSINALTCSDYVFLPMGTNEFDLEGINRTIAWFLDFAYNLHLSTAIGGVILNRTSKESNLSKNERNIVATLNQVIQETFKGLKKKEKRPHNAYKKQYGIPEVLDSFIPRRSFKGNSINGLPGEPLIGADWYEGGYFKRLATEIYRRIY